MSNQIVEAAPLDVQLRSVVHALGMIAAAFAVGIAMVVLGSNVLALLGYTTEGDPLVFNVVGTALQFVGFVLVVLAYLSVTDQWDLVPAGAPGVRAVAWMIAGFVGLFVASYAVVILLTTIGIETGQNAAVQTGSENPAYFLYLIPISVLLVGPGEELVFRGVVQGQLRRAYGPVPAILAASLLFGIVHVVAIVGTFEEFVGYILVAGTLGIVLGVIYEYADNIVVPAVVHGLWNAMLFAVNWYVTVNDVQVPT